MPTAADTITLAGSDVQATPLGVGTWAWGDKTTWGMGGYDTDLSEATIAEAWEACLTDGVTFFDTAEVYGKGESERIIGRLLATTPAHQRSGVVIASKWFPHPLKLKPETAIVEAARASAERLGIERIHLYQIHGPISLRGHGALADGLAAARAAGHIDAVGVSNYSTKETRSMADELAKRGLALATNQIEFSLLRRVPETSGLVAACLELGVTPLAYSPIGQGRLTGKYSASNPPPGRRNFSAHPMEQVDPIVAELRRIGQAHGDRTPSQVALNWLMAKGAIPIPGAKNGRQAHDNAGALGWDLTPEDVATLDRLALAGTRSFANRFWQHG